MSVRISVAKLIEIITSVVIDNEAEGQARLKILVTRSGEVRLLVLDRILGTMTVYEFDDEERQFVQMERQRRTVFDNILFETEFVLISEFLAAPFETVFRVENSNLLVEDDEIEAEIPEAELAQEQPHPSVEPPPVPMPEAAPQAPIAMPQHMVHFTYPYQMPMPYYYPWPGQVFAPSGYY